MPESEKTCSTDKIDGNPKHAAGAAKAPTHCIPPSALFWLGYVMANGAAKYGPFNWGDSAVVWSIYYDAIQRHLNAIQAGEWIDPDSGAPHIAHIMACGCVVLDAQLQGKMIDDRPIGKTAPLGPVMAEIRRLMAGGEVRPHPLAGDPIEVETFSPQEVEEMAAVIEEQAKRLRHPERKNCVNCRYLDARYARIPCQNCMTTPRGEPSAWQPCHPGAKEVTDFARKAGL